VVDEDSDRANVAASEVKGDALCGALDDSCPEDAIPVASGAVGKFLANGEDCGGAGSGGVHGVVWIRAEPTPAP